MPCLLKQKTPNSPGIISFTNNEAYEGVVAKSKKVRDFLINAKKNGDWMCGVHIQGYCGWIKKWPLADWTDFFLWTEPNEPFFSTVPNEIFFPMNCINFFEEDFPKATGNKKYDICVVSHPTELKNIFTCLKLVRKILDKRKKLKVLFIVPDSRKIEYGSSCYRVQGIDRRYFELPLHLFTHEELKDISFISSSNQAFGMFPLAAELIRDLMEESKFMLSLSYYEGTPRIFAEALFCGTPCAINEKTYFGMKRAHNSENTLWLKDDVESAAIQLSEALDNYHKFKVDHQHVREMYSAEINAPKLKTFLTERMTANGWKNEGIWYLKELPTRLPCHGKKLNYQFMHNDKLFFKWIDAVQTFSPYDEDNTVGLPPLDDKPGLIYRLGGIKNQLKQVKRSLFPRQ